LINEGEFISEVLCPEEKSAVPGARVGSGMEFFLERATVAEAVGVGSG